MAHGSTISTPLYVPDAELIGSYPQGTYVNGGSQFPWDFVAASLGAHYGMSGIQEFWADCKRAEINVEFDLHEALSYVDLPPFNYYNGRYNQRNMGWHGIIAAHERASGLVD